MSDNEHEDIPLVEGDDDLDVDINPVEQDPDTGDDDTGDMQNVPEESFQADPDDDKGAEV